MRIRKLGLLAALALSTLVVPLAGGAQPTAKTFRIALLDASSAGARTHLWEAFWQGLRELGYVEGQNIAVDSRWADGKPERLSCRRPRAWQWTRS